jgi:hypothetical protein
MTNTQHTPAPWDLRQDKSIFDNAVLIVASNDGGKTFGGHIVTYLCDPAKYKTCKNFSPDEQMANARLIAAAPELLRFLERWLSTQPGDTYKGYISGQELKAEAQALYTKATTREEV